MFNNLIIKETGNGLSWTLIKLPKAHSYITFIADGLCLDFIVGGLDM
mgnify:CR=1 FL=1